MDKTFIPKCPICPNCDCGKEMEALIEDINGGPNAKCKCRDCGYETTIEVEGTKE